MKLIVCRLFLYLIAISNIKGQTRSSDSRIENVLFDLQNVMALNNFTIWKTLKYRNQFLYTVNSIASHLPEVLTSTYLKEYFDNIEKVYSMDKRRLGTCLKGHKDLRKNIQRRARFHFRNCVSSFQNIAELEESFRKELVKSLEITANGLENCEKSIVAQNHSDFKTACVNSSKFEFLHVLFNSPTSVLDKLVKGENNVQELTKCVTNTSNIAADVIRSNNRLFKGCVAENSNNIQLLDHLETYIYDPVQLEDVFIEQKHEFGPRMEKLIEKINQEIDDLNEIVNRTTNMRKWLSRNPCQREIPKKEFKATVIKVLDEIKPRPDKSRIFECVYEYDQVIDEICRNRAYEVKECYRTVPKRDLLTIENEFERFQILTNDVFLGCLGNVDNLFPVGGIYGCIRNITAKNVEELSRIEEQVYLFLVDSAQIVKLLEECMDFSNHRVFVKESLQKSILKKCLRAKE